MKRRGERLGRKAYGEALLYLEERRRQKRKTWLLVGSVKCVYPPSPRYVDLARAAELARRVPPYVSVVGLFVNATADDIARTVEAVPLTTLQFLGVKKNGRSRRKAEGGKRGGREKEEKKK